MKALEAAGDPTISKNNARHTLKQTGGNRPPQDANSAIELFLDDSESTGTLGTISVKNDQPKSFMHRWFRGGSRPPSLDDTVPSSPAIHWYYQHSNKVPSEMPALPKARSFQDSPTVTKSSQNRRVSIGNYHQYLSIHQEGGPNASTSQDSDAGIIGNDSDSIGTRSMEEMRNARKLMYQRIDDASNNEPGLSRQKVIQALFTVADSLDDVDERNLMRKELDRIMKMEGHVESPHPKKTKSIQTRPKYFRWYFNQQERDRHRRKSAELSSSQTTCANKDGKAKSSLFLSTRKVDHALNDEKKAVERALDDLLWTEFVVNRRKQEEAHHGTRSHQYPTSVLRRDTKKASTPRKTVAFDVRETLQSEPVDESLPVSNLCWGVTGLTTASTKEEASSSSSSSEGDPEDLDSPAGSEGEYDDEGTTESEQNLTYLPTRITVTQSSSEENNPPSPLASTFPLVPSRSDFHNAMKPRNARDRVHLK